MRVSSTSADFATRAEVFQAMDMLVVSYGDGGRNVDVYNPPGVQTSLESFTAGKRGLTAAGQAEIQKVAAAFGHNLPPVPHWAPPAPLVATLPRRPGDLKEAMAKATAEAKQRAAAAAQKAAAEAQYRQDQANAEALAAATARARST
jgi:uncharacterized protein YjbJ (UPF0337 family)